MNLGRAFSVILGVVSDFRVIIIFISVVLYLNFVIFVSRYRKRDYSFKGQLKKKRSTVIIPVPTDTGSSYSGENQIADDEE